MELGARLNCLNGEEHFVGSARGQDIAAVLGHAGKYLRNLFDRFARGKDDFGHAGAERAVMIDLGKADVLERQIAQTVERVVDGGAALANFFEQRLNASAIHQSLPSPR